MSDHPDRIRPFRLLREGQDMSRYNPTPEERHPKEKLQRPALPKKAQTGQRIKSTPTIREAIPAPEKRALTLTFLVKPQGEPYPTDSGSVPLRFQGRVKPCASNHTLETKQRPPPQRHTGALHTRNACPPTDTRPVGPHQENRTEYHTGTPLRYQISGY